MFYLDEVIRVEGAVCADPSHLVRDRVAPQREIARHHTTGRTERFDLAHQWNLRITDHG